jgi:hypothetical protein
MLSNCYQFRRLSKKISLTLTLLIALSIGIANSAVAESLNEYCISQVSQQEVEKPQKNVEEEESFIPPFIGSVDNLPKLYKNACNIFSIECIPKTFFSYSPTLDRVFMQGYRKTTWWGGFVHLEISKSGTKSVPDALVESGFIEDIPELNGALFVGYSGEALFYDGEHVTNLSAYFPKLKGINKIYKTRNWHFRKIANGRMFFVSTGPYSRGLPFIMEIKKGLRTTLIPVPKKFEENTLVELFTMPNSSRLWVATTTSILTEVEGKLQNVFTVSPPSIMYSSNTEQLPDGSIAFQVDNENTKSTTNYILKHASSTDNCEIRMNADKPVLLKPESEINNHKQLKVSIGKIVNSLLKFFKIVD